MAQLIARDRISLENHKERLDKDVRRLVHPSARVVIPEFTPEGLTALLGEVHVPFDYRDAGRYYLDRIAQKVNDEQRLRRGYLGKGKILSITPDLGHRHILEAHGFEIPLDWIPDTRKRLDWASDVLFYMSLNSYLLKPADLKSERVYTPVPFDTYPPGRRSR